MSLYVLMQSVCMIKYLYKLIYRKVKTTKSFKNLSNFRTVTLVFLQSPEDYRFDYLCGVYQVRYFLWWLKSFYEPNGPVSGLYMVLVFDQHEYF